MYDDAVTETLRGIAYSIGFGLFAAAVTYCVVWLVQIHLHRKRRPYDWQRDGECDNRSRPRLLEPDGVLRPATKYDPPPRDLRRWR